MMDDLTVPATRDATRQQLFRQIGIACLLICIAWLAQVLSFDGNGTAGKVAWIILAAIVAGIGVALLAAPYLLSPSD